MTALVLHVPLGRLKTTLAPLRGARTEREVTLAPQPLRVAAVGDGSYEILDGFKRLALWRAEGRREVPVVVESASGVALKARLLQSNAPSKTAGPMDEARVAASLAEEDGLSVSAIAKLLGHKKRWVERRLLLARRLAPELGGRLDRGGLLFTTALSLCAFGKTEQGILVEVISRHALTTREAEAFLATYRAAPDAATREALRRDPRSAQPRVSDQGGSPLGACASDWAAQFDLVEKALEDISKRTANPPHVDEPGLESRPIKNTAPPDLTRRWQDRVARRRLGGMVDDKLLAQFLE